MIIWGGTRDGFSNLNTGGRYSPATDTWTDTSTAGAPLARSGHTAVWTGTEMLIWGGNADNTGGHDNAHPRSWTATSPAHAPRRSNSHNAHSTGTPHSGR